MVKATPRLGAAGQEGLGLLEGSLGHRSDAGRLAANYADDALVLGLRGGTGGSGSGTVDLDDFKGAHEQAKAAKNRFAKPRKGDPLKDGVSPDDLMQPSAPVNRVAEAEQRAAAAAQAGSTTDRVLDGANTAMQYASFVPLAGVGLTMASGLMGKVGGGMNKLAGSPLGLDKAAGVVAKPVELLEKTTMADVGKATRVGGVVGGATQAVFNPLGRLVGGIADKTGFSGWRERAHTAKAAHHYKDVGGLISDLGGVSPNHPEVKGHWKDLLKAAGDGKSAASIDPLKFEEASKALTELAGKDKAAAAALKGVAPKLETLTQKVTYAASHHADARGWGDVKGTIQGAPSKMAKGSINHTLMNGAFIGMSGIDMIQEGRGYMKQSDAAALMQAETGNPKSGVLADAQRHAMMSSGLKFAAKTAGLVVNIRQAIKNPASMWKGMAALMAPQLAVTGVDMVMGENVLPMYKALSDAHKQGREIPVEAYAAFIGAASKEIKAKGGATSPFAMALAEQYAKEKAAPAIIVNEIDNGKLMERVKALIAANEASKAELQKANHEHVASGHSHVQALSGGGKKLPEKKPMEALGKHTAKVVQEAHAPALGHTPSPA